MKNEKYWNKRQKEKLFGILDKSEVTSDYIGNVYYKSASYLKKQMEGIFETYKAKNGLSLQEAKQLLFSLEDPHDYDEMIKKLSLSSGQERKELLKKLDAPAYRYRINRLKDMQNQVDLVMNNIYNVEKDKSTNSYIDSAFNAYYKNVYNVQNLTGVAYQFNELDPNLVDNMLRSKWSGKNYSQRIWDNTNALADSLKNEMMLGVLTNKTEKEMSDTIMQRFSVGNYQARRLIQTESAAVTSFADQLAFKDAGIEKEMFIAVHDSRTSRVCQDHDRSIVEMSKAEVGVNVPPLHPNCRSHMIPYIDGMTDKMKKRQRNPNTGKDEIVNADEKYSQWLKRQQEEQGIDTVDTFIKKTKNVSSDRKQYNRYIEVLGSKLMPNSLNKFQKIKYEDKIQWNDLKYKYRTVNRYKVDYGSVDAETILELDKQAFTAKDEYMTTKAGKGNVAAMKIGDDIYIASSQISKISEPNYLNYVGDKEKLILLPNVTRLTPHLKLVPYNGHEGEYSRDIDTEYKFFEYIYDKILKGKLKNQEVYILSQKDMCFSCNSVYNELIRKQEVLDANIGINVVSGKSNKSWDYRKYKTKALDNLKKRVKK